jgi:hypothetical protein
LPLTLRRRRKVETAGVEPASPRCKRGALPDELHPRVMRTGGVEPPQREAAALQAAELTNAQRPHGLRGDRPDSNRRRGDHDPECFRLHHGHSGDDRNRTGGLSPDKASALRAGATPPPRERGRDSNPRSRAHEAREDSHSSTAQVWLAGVEPAISGVRGRRGGQLPHSQKKHQRPVGAGGPTGSTSSPSPRRDRFSPLPRGRPARRRRRY